MIIEKTSKELIIRLSASLDISDLEEMVEYLRYKEITSKSRATKTDVENLVSDIKKGRWAKARKRLIK